MYAINKLCCTLAICGLCLPVIVAAQDAVELTDQIRHCARLTDASSRLNCYDMLSDSLQADTSVKTQQVPAAPPRKPDPVVSTPTVTATAPAAASVPAAKPKPRKKSLFGSKADQPPDVQLTLVNSAKDSFGRWLFYFENGEVWRQTEKGYVSIPGGAAVPAMLSAGVFGSNNLQLGDVKKKIKVTRVE